MISSQFVYIKPVCFIFNHQPIMQYKNSMKSTSTINPANTETQMICSFIKMIVEKWMCHYTSFPTILNMLSNITNKE